MESLVLLSRVWAHRNPSIAQQSINQHLHQCFQGLFWHQGRCLIQQQCSTLQQVLQPIISKLTIIFASSMSKSQRSATLTPQKGSQVSINRPVRSQTANKNKSFLMVTTLDQSKVKPIGKLKPKAQYHIIDSFIKDDKIAYMGECQGKKKVFNRSAFLTNNQLFGQLIRYYEVQVLEMVKNLDSQREGQAKNNL